MRTRKNCKFPVQADMDDLLFELSIRRGVQGRVYVRTADAGMLSVALTPGGVWLPPLSVRVVSICELPWRHAAVAVRPMFLKYRPTDESVQCCAIRPDQ